jgi:hypothetical protein
MINRIQLFFFVSAPRNHSFQGDEECGGQYGGMDQNMVMRGWMGSFLPLSISTVFCLDFCFLLFCIIGG